MNEESEQPTPEVKQEGEEEEERVLLKDDLELKYKHCKYCKGIIPKTIRRAVTHCSKVCSETNKVVPNKSFLPETGKWELKTTFSVEKDWGYYKEVLRDKATPTSSFSQTTQTVSGLEVGMKLECLDISNPVNYCVATIIKIFCHRICLRYDGFGQDSSHDFWCNFQAEELFPIGWCAQNNYHLQPPTGISCTHAEWKAFLSRTLTGALAAPLDLFKKPENRRQLRCHNYLPGSKVEVIHPARPDVIVPATVTKSLGPYYYLVTTDSLPNVTSKTFYGFADCPNVYQHGWCDSRGLELVVPTDGSDIKMLRKEAGGLELGNHGIGKRSRINSYKITSKLEALDGDDIVRVATVAEVFGRVALLVFDDLHHTKFIDKNTSDVFPIGWSETAKGCLYTPYGPVDFHDTNPTIGVDAKKNKSSEIESASFKSFLEHMKLKSTAKILSQASTGSTTITITSNKSPATDEKSIPSSAPAHDVNSQSGSSSMDVDIPAEISASPTVSHAASVEIKKSDLDKFVIWLLNTYEIDMEDRCSVVKADLVDKFSAYTNRVLSPRWFTSIYKLFPHVQSTRKPSGTRFVNCLKFLREKLPEKNVGAIYVKDACEFLKSKSINTQLGNDRLVAFLSLTGHFSDDTQDIFDTGKAPKGSGIFVISADISTTEFTLHNFEFHYERRFCTAPIPQISNMNDFRAALILCKQASLCTGVEYQLKNEPFKSLNNKMVRNARKFSKSCNVVAYPHKGSVCPHCKNIRSRTNCATANQQQHYPQQPQQQQQQQQQQPSYPLNDALDDSLNDELEELTNSKDEEEGATYELKIYFNKSCYPGLYLNPDKVAQIAPHTPQEKPAQVLKYLIDRLMEVSYNKEQFLEIIEAAFGNRVFNKSKDKVVKKGLFRFNTRIKVLRFMNRLMKKLVCCDSFLSIDPSPCLFMCKGNEGYPRKKKEHAVSSDESNYPTSSGTSPATVVVQSQQSSKKGKINPGQVINTSQGNVQVLYQLPPSMIVSTSSAMPQHYVVQNSAAATTKNPNLQQHRFPQATQFFLPQTSGGVTYMVVSNKDKTPSGTATTTTVQSPAPASSHMIGHSLSSPPAAGVSQMLANVSKTNLLTDIDSPSSKSASNTNTVWVKSENAQDRYEQQRQRAVEERKSVFQELKYTGPMADSSRSQFNPSMRPTDKGHQIHVHKVHHGNARVKYVEFKPVQNNSPNSPHGFNQYYQNQQHLSVQTQQGQPPKSPLHSPPALRPPPSIPPRSVALHSPPSLVMSPEVRPRFEYQNVRSPVQVTNMVYNKQHGGMKPNINHSINLPRLPSFQNQPNSPGGLNQGGKPTVIQAYRGAPPTDNKMFQSNSGCATTTVTMTYIPIQTSTSNKLVYVPVNSLQNNQGQPMVLYPHNQTLKDRNGKPVILSPQLLQKQGAGNNNKNVVVVPPSPKGENGGGGGAFTTVRIQGASQGGGVALSNGSTDLSDSMGQQVGSTHVKPFKYQFGSHFTPTNPNSPTDQQPPQFEGAVLQQTRNEDVLVNNAYHPPLDRPIKMEEGAEHIRSAGEIMNLINNSAGDSGAPPFNHMSYNHTPYVPPITMSAAGNKRKLSTAERKNDSDTPDHLKQKKRRGRPPSSTKNQNKGQRAIAPAQMASPTTLANRVLTDAFFKKQQQSNQPNHFEEPLQKCPGLPENPEQWTPDDVFKYLSVTDCAQYAAALKDEEMDGKSFLLLTRDALMEFKGLRLGPALKIVGYSSYLRAKNRVLNINKKDSAIKQRSSSSTVQKNGSKTQTRNVEKNDNQDKTQTKNPTLETVSEAVRLKEITHNENTDPTEIISPRSQQETEALDKRENFIDAEMALHVEKSTEPKAEEMERENDQKLQQMEI